MVAVGCGLALTFTLVLLATMPMVRDLSGSRDYVVYWATGQQLVHHANPYDPEQMGRLEHQAGLKVPGAYYMRNPPWTLPLAYPLGFISVRAGALPWSLLMLGLLISSVRMLTRAMQPAAPQRAILGYCFPPALICVVMGQTSLILLIGLVLFVRLRDIRPFWAGASLWLCTMKPHLLLPFGIVLLLWIVRNRKYKVLAGLALSLAISWAVTVWIDPAAWRQYIQWVKQSGIQTEFIPCLGVLIRQWIDPATGWLAFTPAVLGCIWAAGYYWSRPNCWDWYQHGGMVVLISLLAAPYCWIWDQSLALFALLPGAYVTSSRRVFGLLGIIYIVLEVMQFSGVGYRSALYLWPAVAWPIWTSIARRERGLAASIPGVSTAS